MNESVKLGFKKYNNPGIPGYEIKGWNHDVNKPIVFGIHSDTKGMQRHFLDPILKQKLGVPSPASYNISKDFIFKHNMITSKSPRNTEA